MGQLADVPGAEGFDEPVLAAETVTLADADMLSSASLVAVIVSVPDFDGAVYAPDEVIVPSAAVQLTALFVTLP